MNILITVALLPALFTEGGEPGEPVTTVLISAPLESSTTTTTAAPTTTTTTAAPTTTTVAPVPPTTAKPHVDATTSTTAHTREAPAPKPKATTTTTAAPHTHEEPAPAAAPASNSEEGRATWYELEGARAGICAHKTLPFGTIVTVTNTNTGKSIRCEVGDRGPFVDGYIIDLFRTDFEQLQPTSKGWFPARITW